MLPALRLWMTCAVAERQAESKRLWLKGSPNGELREAVALMTLHFASSTACSPLLAVAIAQCFKQRVYGGSVVRKG